MEEDKREGIMRVVAYELRLAERYRFYTSLAFLTSSDRGASVAQALQGTVRHSDLMVDLGTACLVVMAHTGKEDAERAVERYRRWCDGALSLRHAVVTYPGDGATPWVLLEKGEARLLAACTAAAPLNGSMHSAHGQRSSSQGVV